nr:MAG TPA_asm: hypothetical protein [Caudoviricetes sp.]
MLFRFSPISCILCRIGNFIWIYVPILSIWCL